MAKIAGAVPLTSVQSHGQPVFPCSLSAGWQTLAFAVTATTAVTVAALGSPDSLTVATSTPFYRDKNLGTNVRVRVIYDDDATAVGTPLIYRLWGRTEGKEWQVLANRTGSLAVTPTFGFAAADPVIATDYRATNDALDDCTFDCDGCDEFFIEITQGMALTGGTDSQARFQVKLI